MIIEPMIGKVIAKEMPSEQKQTKSGIYIPDKVAENMRFVKGKVIATADKKFIGEKLMDMQVKVGDIILFDEYTTKEFMYEGGKYYCMEEPNIFGRLK